MASQKLQVGRAWAVIPSNNTDIPFPDVITTGITTDDSISNALIDESGVDFTTMGIKSGDIVYNTAAGTSAYIVKVASPTTLILSADIFGVGDSYTIYIGDQNNGCVLYVGGAGDLTVETVGHDTVTFYGVLAGQFIPVQVLKVFPASTATNILALW